MGDRVRIVGGPWPERVGAAGRIADRPPGRDGQVYPWTGRCPSEVIVLLDKDPLWGKARTRGWTCVMNRHDIEVFP